MLPTPGGGLGGPHWDLFQIPFLSVLLVFMFVYRWELAEREDLKKYHKVLDNWRLTGNIYRMEQVYDWRFTDNIYRMEQVY